MLCRRLRNHIHLATFAVAHASQLTHSATHCASIAGMRLLNQKEAIQVDEDLMMTPGYSIDQLMELAGLSVAAAVFKAYPPSTHPRVLCVCGPGNNGVC